MRRITIVCLLVALAASVQPSIRVEAATPKLNVVALGDSYTSGNGALDYENRDCYRSANAYVYVFGNLLKTAGFDVTSNNFACHGAKTSDIAGQIAAAGDRLRDADVVVMTIGGNDADFTQIVINCLAITRYAKLCHDNIDTARNQLDELVQNVKQAVVDVAKAAPKAHVVLIGYPYLVESCHSDYNIVRSLQSAVEARYDLAIRDLDHIPLLTAGRVHYVSLISSFEGGGVCGDGDQLIRGSLDTFPTNFEEWWHPNVQGHQVIANELFKSREEFAIVVGQQPPSSPPPASVGSYHYGNLPLACGVTVARATTYDSYNYQGRVFWHSYAIDLPVPLSTKVVSPVSGKAYVYWEPSGYGRYIDVVDGSGRTHRMAHMMSDVAIRNGQSVQQGQLLGRVGLTGATTGPHLHYEQRVGNRAVDIVFDGPALAWSAPAANGGDRYTLHTLISNNCHDNDIVWGGVGSGAIFKGNARLEPGEYLRPGEYIVSPNVRAVLILRSNGNLVLAADGKVVWQSGTVGSGAIKAVMQGDGNFVLYNTHGKAVWTTYQDRYPPSRTRQFGSWLQVQDDGNVVIYFPSGGYLWHSHTDGSVSQPVVSRFGSKLMPGQYLSRNQYLRSADRRYALLFQADGNLVLYGPGYKVLWHAATHGSGAIKAVMQGDGNFVIYKEVAWVWQSCSNGHNADKAWLNLQNDANLVVYNHSVSRHYWDRFSQPGPCWK